MCHFIIPQTMYEGFSFFISSPRLIIGGLVDSFIHSFIEQLGNFLVVQWLRLHASSAGGPGSVPGQGTKPDKSHLRVCMLQGKDLACGKED